MDKIVANKSELVIDALQYAHDHNLDISNKDEVRQILDAVDPEHKEDLDEFMEHMNTSDVFLGMKARENKKSDLLN